jgi:hypothetical protein
VRGRCIVVWILRGAAAMGLGVVVALGGAQAQTLGRLFTTPDVRAALDQLRQDQDYGRAVVTDKRHAQPRVRVPDVQVNGVVVRSAGPDASWINGTIVTPGDSTPSGVRVETGGGSEPGVRIVLPGSAQVLHLKPGQRVDVLDGRVLDAYEKTPHTEGDQPARGGSAAGRDAASAPEASVPHDR